MLLILLLSWIRNIRNLKVSKRRIAQRLVTLYTSDQASTLEVILGWADAHWEIGRAFGTIGLRKGKYLIEVTTYRSDVYDRTSRKPSVTFGTTLSDDLVRRDFTVNAMAVRFPSLEFVDEHGGLADLASRVLRTPSAPEEIGRAHV